MSLQNRVNRSLVMSYAFIVCIEILLDYVYRMSVCLSFCFLMSMGRINVRIRLEQRRDKSEEANCHM